ncbi:MAG: hypothetical protein AAGD22_02500 [Verrucomicrobiota bacterium]
MSDRAEDTPLNRFVAFWWALAVFLSFGVLTVLVAGSRSCAGGSAMDGYDALVVKERDAKLTAVMGAQAEAMAGSAVPISDAIDTAAKELSAMKPTVTEVPIPGSAAAMGGAAVVVVEEEETVVEAGGEEVEGVEGEGAGDGEEVEGSE